MLNKMKTKRLKHFSATQFFVLVQFIVFFGCILLFSWSQANSMDVRIKLQPKQKEAFHQLEDGDSQYLFYGGAKAGGKSYLVRGSQFARRMKYPHTTGAIFRKTFPELLDNHIRKFFIEYPFITDWYKSSEKTIYFPNGSLLSFKHLDSEMDVYKQQGIEYDDICLDEATQHTENVFKVLKTSLRKDPSIHSRLNALGLNYKPKFLLTGNPGGIGHEWCKRLYVERDFTPTEKPKDYKFIQALIWDNPVFLEQNLEYLDNLRDLPEELRKAYLEGDWDIFAGKYFKKLRHHIHVIDPLPIHPDWRKFISIDWGFAHNACVIWWQVDFQGNAYVYRHLLINETVPSHLAQKIREMTPDNEKISIHVGGTDFKRRVQTDELYTDKTFEDIFAQNGIHLQMAVTDRVMGWQAVREYLEYVEDNETGELIKPPKVYIYSTSEAIYKGLSRLIHDDHKPEDVQKMEGDDEGDCFRYGIMHIYKPYKVAAQLTQQQQMVKRLFAKKTQKAWGSNL